MDILIYKKKIRYLAEFMYISVFFPLQELLSLHQCHVWSEEACGEIVRGPGDSSDDVRRAAHAPEPGGAPGQLGGAPPGPRWLP